MHPRWLRCSSLKYSRYSRSSRLAIGAGPPTRQPRWGPRGASPASVRRRDFHHGLLAERATLPSLMRIAIVGSGGVGGYFGGRLGATGVDVTFLARGAHLEALHTRGLRIESPKGNLHLPRVNASDDPVAIGPADIVFFAVKLYDTEGALALLPPLLGPDTVVIPLQNGVDSVAMLTRAVGQAHPAGGTCYVSD